MIIVETKHPDVTDSNIDTSKIILAENIIKNVYPLFDDVYTEKVSQVRKLTKLLDARKEKVVDNKNNLEIMMRQYERKKKVAAIFVKKSESRIKAALDMILSDDRSVLDMHQEITRAESKD